MALIFKGENNMTINDGILYDCVIENNLAKFIEKGLRQDCTKSIKEKSYIRNLLVNSASKYIDLRRFMEDFKLENMEYKEMLEYFLLNFDEISMYGNRLYIEYRCYKNYSLFEDDALEEGYLEALKEEKQYKKIV